MRPAETIIQNDSDQSVVLVHTSLANEGETNAYQATGRPRLQMPGRELSRVNL